MFVAVNQYIELIGDSEPYTKTLGVIDVCRRDASGRPLCFVGNNSVIFKIRHEGRTRMLKCYTVPKRNLRRIYGERCLHDELFVPCGGSGEYVDVVLADWVEGRTLKRAIREAAGDSEAMGGLAREFDRFALELLDAEWAHGDLKPENIIVDDEGRMHAIDFDAVYRPDLADLRSEEVGTAAFQHPQRGRWMYDKAMDDYPIALISSALHALAADESLWESVETDAFLVFDPHDMVRGKCRLLASILKMFAGRCMGAEYQIAKLLASPSPYLPRLRNLLRWKTARLSEERNGTPVLEVDNGLWGYKSGGRFVVAPLFDCGWEYRNGRALVELGGFRHQIQI